jgi:hypothetical protein
MEILNKALGKGEVNWKGVVLPREKKSLFPAPGIYFDLVDGKEVYKVKLDGQFRIRLAPWFQQHPAIRPGDRIIISRDNGRMHIALSKNFSEPERGVFEWVEEVMQAIRNGEIHGILELRQDGFSVKIGKELKETEIKFLKN